MKISAERASWKNIKNLASGSESVGYVSGFGYVRASMDLPQLRLAVGGNYEFPAVTIALRIASAWIFAYLFYKRNLTLDFMLHILNFSVNGWTYGLVCELAILLPGWEPVFALKLILWAAVMKGIDILLGGWVEDDEFTAKTGVQDSLRPFFLIIIGWIILKPSLSSMFGNGLVLYFPSPILLVEIATAMAVCFLYRLIKLSEKKPAWASAYTFWLKSMFSLSRHVSQWPFWLPVWAAIGALAFHFGMGGLSLSIQWYLDFVLGLLLIPVLSPLWSIVMDWFDGNIFVEYNFYDD